MISPDSLDKKHILHLSNSLPFGVLIVTTDIELIYRNQTARDIFQSVNIHAPNGIPQALINYCKQFMQEVDEGGTEPLIIDCQPCKSRLLRWQISWFTESIPAAKGKRCILVVLEDCYQNLILQMNRDQQRYGLTDQEARVWIMLSFGMRYQEIADNLRIKLNTVKTHARNIYNKQRNHKPGAPRLWFLDDEFLCGNPSSRE